MDKDFSSVGIQYIICECGDNFPNENLLNIHLANDHADVDTFPCDVELVPELSMEICPMESYDGTFADAYKYKIIKCPEVFSSNSLLHLHKITHKSKTQKTPLKTYSRQKQNTETKRPQLEETPIAKQQLLKKPLFVKPTLEKQTPVIKVQTLKRIDSISLIQNLKTYGKFIKIEPPIQPESPEPQPSPEAPEESRPVLEEVVMEEPRVAVKKEAPVKNEEPSDDDEEIYYQCDVCNSIFYTEAEFEVHYQSAHVLKMEPPTAEEVLEEHLATDHGRVHHTAYYYECEICHKIFANEKFFNIHYNKVHGGLLDIITEEAAEDAQTEETEVEPETATSTDEAKPKAPEQVIYYKCDLCKILYPSERAYNLHFDKKHGGQSCYEIQTTGFQFIEQDLSGACSLPEPTGDTFACDFCPKTFPMKRSLQVHRKRVHADRLREDAADPGRSNRSKVCDICGRAYNSNAALRYHQRRHTGEKPYPCTICPKRFTMPMFLQIHMRTHTGEKPYECPHCPKAFTNKAALIRHDRVHTGVKPYPCPECGKYFTQSNSMKLHVSTVHLKLPAPYKSKSRRSKSEARALQLALKNLPQEEEALVLGA